MTKIGEKVAARTKGKRGRKEENLRNGEVAAAGGDRRETGTENSASFSEVKASGVWMERKRRFWLLPCWIVLPVGFFWALGI